MNRITITNIFVFLLMLSAAATAVFGASTDAPGTIKGKVNYCGAGGYLGMQVYIPGRQFMVLLGKDGHFIFEGVPAGNYNINYVINGRMVNENKNISVSAGATNNLGSIVFCAEDTSKKMESGAVIEAPSDPCESAPESSGCIDADKDGVVAAKDCNDNDASVRPGAVEICDGIDNNCDGQIDELKLVGISNGMGNCVNGKISVNSCSKGFGDCDKDPSNGCEVDINNDVENCGSCGNTCSTLESCDLGIC